LSFYEWLSSLVNYSSEI